MDIARQVIDVTKGSESINHNFLPNGDLAGLMEPFPRSSVMIDDSFGKLMMYFVDRSFNFVSYCLEGYLNRNMTMSREPYQMNRTIINGQCSNLKQIFMNDQKMFMILFCLSVDKDNR